MVYWDFFKWAKDEQELAVGEVFKNVYPDDTSEYLIIGLDEFTADWFRTEYSMISVFKLRAYGQHKEKLRVHLPSTDDTALFIDFEPNIDINLSTLTELIYSWAQRSNYRYINAHALEDYCKHLGAHYIDWN